MQWKRLAVSVGLWFTAVATTVAAPLPSAPAPSLVQVGVLAVLDDQDTVERWQPWLQGLQDKLPALRFQLRPLAPDAMAQALNQQQLSFVITNPGHYVLLESKFGATRIATQSIARHGDSAHAVGSAVVVRGDSRQPGPVALCVALLQRRHDRLRQRGHEGLALVDPA